MKILFWLKENAWVLFIIAVLLLVYLLNGCKKPTEAKPVQAEIMLLDGEEVVFSEGEIYPVKYRTDTRVWYDCDSSYWMETWYADTCWPDTCPFRYDTLILHFSNCKELEL